MFLASLLQQFDFLRNISRNLHLQNLPSIHSHSNARPHLLLLRKRILIPDPPLHRLALTNTLNPLQHMRQRFPLLVREKFVL